MVEKIVFVGFTPNEDSDKVNLEALLAAFSFEPVFVENFPHLLRSISEQNLIGEVKGIIAYDKHANSQLVDAARAVLSSSDKKETVPLEKIDFPLSMNDVYERIGLFLKRTRNPQG